MSKRINVNPDHYKVAGRERQGHAIAKAPKDQGDDAKARARWERSRQKSGTRTPQPQSKK